MIKLFTPAAASGELVTTVPGGSHTPAIQYSQTGLRISLNGTVIVRFTPQSNPHAAVPSIKVKKGDALLFEYMNYMYSVVYGSFTHKVTEDYTGLYLSCPLGYGYSPYHLQFGAAGAYSKVPTSITLRDLSSCIHFDPSDDTVTTKMPVEYEAWWIGNWGWPSVHVVVAYKPPSGTWTGLASGDLEIDEGSTNAFAFQLPELPVGSSLRFSMDGEEGQALRSFEGTFDARIESQEAVIYGEGYYGDYNPATGNYDDYCELGNETPSRNGLTTRLLLDLPKAEPVHKNALGFGAGI